MNALRAPVLVCVFVGTLGGVVPATAQVQLDGPLVPGDTVLATPRDRYPAGFLHRAILGRGHRGLWDLAVPAPVLDLDAFAGGLTLEGLGGGNQTRSLRFVGADERPYNFRSIDKDASRTLAPELRRSVAAWILQDQISSLFPLSASVVAPLMEAAGVLHPEPVLRVMPDDPRLGPHREEFAGMLGWMEERPNEGPDGTQGFAASVRVVGSERLWELLEESPDHRVAAESLLRARLVDALVGDWDRHPGQWRWARFERDGRFVYEPIARDRDWALARIDGAFTRLSWMPWPQYKGFGGPIGSAFRRTWNGQALDRRLLTGLSWGEWSAITDDLVARLDDRVLADAVGTLPEAYRQAVGAALEAELRARRDELTAYSRNFYDLLAGWVDVHGTDVAELARIERLGPDTVRVRISTLMNGTPSGAPHYARDFLAGETGEVRIDLHGGDDHVEVSGHPDGRIVIRVEGGGGSDTYDDRTSGAGVHFYDGGGGHVAAGSATPVDTRPWAEPYDPRTRTDWVPARDWGARTLPAPEVGYSPDWGVTLGMGARREWYGFRTWPHRAALEVGAGVLSATGRAQGYADLDLQVSAESRGHISLEVRGAEVRRFYGFGNDTRSVGPDDAFHAERIELALSGGLRRRLGDHASLGGGIAVRRFTDLDNEGTLVESLRPYGYPDFRQVELTAGLEAEGPDPASPLAGPSTLRVEASWFPALLDVEETFTTVEVDAATSVTLAADARMPPVLALRAGGRRAWGPYPYHEAARLGGGNGLRGFPNQRFAGDASVYMNAEVRVGIGRIFLLLPGDLGVFGLVDTGRIFQQGESSGTWHTAVGGGLWVSFLNAYAATISVARGSITGVYATVGFPF